MTKFLLILLLFPFSLFAWNGSDHQLIGKHALEPVKSNFQLGIPVQVTPLSALLKKLPAGIGDIWHFSNWLGIDPGIDIEEPVPELMGKETVTPIEVLSLYAIDPDDGRDQNLFDRDEKGKPIARYADQKWFGALEGPNSQAFRHIEKPPFSFRKPRSTFGFPFRAVGEASKRAEIWFQLSQLAFELGEDYWGWRFLANSFHYLQDLHNPYHAGQITPEMAFKGFRAWFEWGRQQEGFVGTFAHLISNSHRFFESYVANPRGHDEGLKQQALLALEGRDFQSPLSSVQKLAEEIRDQSNNFFPSLLDAVTEATDPRLLGPITYNSDDPGADNPEQFLRKRDSFQQANQKIFRITHGRFASAGSIMRSVVKKSLDERGKKKTEELIQQLNQLLEYETILLDSESPPHQ
ncbi:MAG: hypothetical protein HYT76_04165 [Deltaproteobacteria bacterium]|nr:hypothetical protein [Deltaproteobacteria bacterium]